MASAHQTIRWADLHAIFGDAYPIAKKRGSTSSSSGQVPLDGTATPLSATAGAASTSSPRSAAGEGTGRQQRSASSATTASSTAPSAAASSMPAAPTRETTFSKPLVIHVREDAGPSHVELQAARDKVIKALKAKEKDGSLGENIKVSLMRDVELFHAALPFLRDTSLTPEQTKNLRAGLDVMRSVVAGSLTLGGNQNNKSRGGGGGQSAGQQAVDAYDEDNLLHEMKVSLLDFHVVFGHRVETYKRIADTVDGKGEGSRRAAVAVKYEPQGGKIKAPHEVISQEYVYVPSQEWDRRKRATEKKKEDERKRQGLAFKGNQDQTFTLSPRSGRPATAPNRQSGPSAAEEDRLQTLKKNLDAPLRRATNTSTRSGKGTDATSSHGGESSGDESTSRSASSRQQSSTNSTVGFKAPIPPEKRSRQTIKRNILHQWSESRPQTARAQQSVLTRSHQKRRESGSSVGSAASASPRDPVSGTSTPRPQRTPRPNTARGASSRLFSNTTPNKRVILDEWRADHNDGDEDTHGVGATSGDSKKAEMEEVANAGTFHFEYLPPVHFRDAAHESDTEVVPMAQKKNPAEKGNGERAFVTAVEESDDSSDDADTEVTATKKGVKLVAKPPSGRPAAKGGRHTTATTKKKRSISDDVDPNMEHSKRLQQPDFEEHQRKRQLPVGESNVDEDGNDIGPIVDWREYTMRHTFSSKDNGMWFDDRPLVVTMDDGRVEEVSFVPRVDPAIATRWKHRHHHTRLKLELKTRKELLSRDAHRSRVVGNATHMAEIAKRAEAAGRLWSVAHGSKGKRRSSIWSRECNRMADRVATAQQRRNLYHTFVDFMQRIRGPHTYSGQLIAEKIVDRLNNPSQQLLSTIVDEVLDEVVAACERSGKPGQQESLSIEAEKMAAFLREGLLLCEVENK